MDEIINFKELFKKIKRYLFLTITVAIFSAVIAGVVTFYYLTPVYQATAQLLINTEQNEQTGISFSNIQTDLQLINTYSVIIKSPVVLEQVAEELGGVFTTDELNEKIMVQTESSSQVVNLTVTDTDPLQAAEIANITADIFQNEIVDLMSVDNVRLLTPAAASTNQSPVEPNLIVNVAVSGLIGAMFTLTIAMMKEYLDITIKAEQDLAELDLPFLGAVNLLSDQKMKKIYTTKKSGEKVIPVRRDLYEDQKEKQTI
ncbi:YveK family protein [Jeotgalibacillus salarius]|uniref:YveK family protein n=1 Tax=Jeotgalibacillus salarius TaxID=546023 RepID=UPI00141A9447|nr:Wzz/FepE/Etk N-terminal domain-containing protein [Jeotgalibacillus salarius]